MRASLLLVPAMAIALLTPAKAEACSKLRFGGSRLAGQEALIAIATADTVAVPKSGKLPRAFGMVARIDKLGAASSLTSSEVVLIPWDFGADCEPMPWTRPTAWVPAGKRGLYVGTLRKRSEWVGGRPTIDVHFPGGFPYAEAKPTADEILTVHDLLPLIRGGELDSARAHAAYAPLLRWEREHAALARTSPIDQMIFQAKSVIMHARLSAIRSPLAGTYRITASVTGGDSITFFAATEERPVSHLSGASSDAKDLLDAQGIVVPAGYNLPAGAARTQAGAQRFDWRRPGMEMREGYLTAMIQPAFTSADSTVWQGSIDVLSAGAALVADSARRQRLRRRFDEYQQKAPSYVPGRFVKHEDGRVTFTAKYSLPGRPALLVRGVRVSQEVMAVRR